MSPHNATVPLSEARFSFIRRHTSPGCSAAACRNTSRFPSEVYATVRSHPPMSSVPSRLHSNAARASSMSVQRAESVRFRIWDKNAGMTLTSAPVRECERCRVSSASLSSLSVVISLPSSNACSRSDAASIAPLSDTVFLMPFESAIHRSREIHKSVSVRENISAMSAILSVSQSNRRTGVLSSFVSWVTM